MRVVEVRMSLLVLPLEDVFKQLVDEPRDRRRRDLKQNSRRRPGKESFYAFHLVDRGGSRSDALNKKVNNERCPLPTQQSWVTWLDGYFRSISYRRRLARW